VRARHRLPRDLVLARVGPGFVRRRPPLLILVPGHAPLSRTMAVPAGRRSGAGMRVVYARYGAGPPGIGWPAVAIAFAGPAGSRLVQPLQLSSSAGAQTCARPRRARCQDAQAAPGTLLR